WQVNRHSNVIFENRLIMDCWYIGNWSFWLDLVLLLKTIGIVLDKKGAK
ncbi:sugar transferase, partial [Bacteroides ovatus]